MSTEPIMLLCWRNKKNIATRFLQANVCISVHHCGGRVAHGVQFVELATSLVTHIVNELVATENVLPATWRDQARTVAITADSCPVMFFSQKAFASIQTGDKSLQNFPAAHPPQCGDTRRDGKEMQDCFFSEQDGNNNTD